MDSIKKIIVVAESIDVDDSSGSKANVALIRNLHEAGYDLQVYHYTRKNIQLKDISTFSLPENRKSLLFFLSRIERHLRYQFGNGINAWVEKKFGFSFTLMNDRKSIAKGLKNIKDYNPDLVITLSKGGSFRPHHALLRLPEFHEKWIAYIHDPYPMHSYPRPYDWVEPGHEMKRNFFLKVASNCAFAAYPSKLLAQWMESYYPELKGKRVIIPHQISSADKLESDLPAFFNADAFNVVHAGALMGARNPLSLVRAFKKFIKDCPEAGEHSQLIFLGARSRYSEQFHNYKEKMPQLYSSDENLPFATVRSIQSRASVNVILEAKGPSSPFLPGKFPHCIQSEKPILLLGPYYSECRRLLGEDYRWWSEIDDEERILQHIKSLYDSWLKDNRNLKKKYFRLKEYMSAPHLKKVIEQLNVPKALS